MNYSRIYSKFIASRRAREAGLVGYYETHHIVPVSFGGTNESENLIKLTAGDHYFAHLCLAKMHGGKMWAAVWALAGMITSRDRFASFRHRKMVAVARKQMGRHMSKQRKGIPKPKVRGELNGMAKAGVRERHAEAVRADDYKRTISDAQKRVWERDDVRSARTDAFAAAWADPVKSAKRRASLQTADFRKSQSEKIKALWADPNYRAAQLAAFREKAALRRAAKGEATMQGTGA